MAKKPCELPWSEPRRETSNVQFCKGKDEDWSGWADAKRRRKAQNLLNQRASRERKRQEKLQQKLQIRPRLGPRVLRPKVPEEKKGNELGWSGRPYGIDDQLAIIPTGFESSPSYALNTLEFQSPVLSNKLTRRLFHYATSSVWPSMAHAVMPSKEPIGSALARACMMDELLLRCAIWGNAQELLLHGYNAEMEKLRLCEQTETLSQARRLLAEGKVTDGVVWTMFAISYSVDGPLQQFPAHDFTLGLFDSPIREAGHLKWLSRYKYTCSHWALWPQLLGRRGGIASVAHPGIAEVIQMGDLICASIYRTVPPIGLCNSASYFAAEILPGMRPPTSEVDLFPVIDDGLRSALLDLKLSRRLVEKRCNGEDAEFLVETRDMAHYRLLRVPPGGPDEVCRLAALIFSLGVTFPLDNPEPFPALIREFMHALQAPKFATGLDADFLFWATMMGAVAAGRTDDEAFFVEKLRGLLVDVGILTWEDAKDLLSRYLWLDRACDEGARYIWGKVVITDMCRRTNELYMY